MLWTEILRPGRLIEGGKTTSRGGLAVALRFQISGLRVLPLEVRGAGEREEGAPSSVSIETK